MNEQPSKTRSLESPTKQKSGQGAAPVGNTIEGTKVTRRENSANTAGEYLVELRET